MPIPSDELLLHSHPIQVSLSLLNQSVFARASLATICNDSFKIFTFRLSSRFLRWLFDGNNRR